jgi:hypothetical protein
MPFMCCLCWIVLWAILVADCEMAAADPRALRADIQIRKILNVAPNTVRLVKDPRDHTLYTSTMEGTISRIDLSEGAASSEVLYTAADHGMNSLVQGFAIGPDGTFYLVSNTSGKVSFQIEAIVRGALDPASGERVWSALDQTQPLPTDVALDEILADAENLSPLARDPRDNTLYIINSDGNITRGIRDIIYTVTDHGVASPAGLVIGSDGTFYIFTTNTKDLTKYNIAAIAKGVLDADTGLRVWSVLARTEPIPKGFDHYYNAIVVSPDNRYIFVNSGARTDHGEVKNNGGAFPNVREVPLTSCILRLPTDGQDLFLPNDEEALRSAGYLYADGVRNTFDLAYAPNGDLFGVENGPDRDMHEEMNWIRQGHHYGFPWRMGSEDNPQRFPDYDPKKDRLLQPAILGAGSYHNDPNYPPPPMEFTDPVINVGPDADKFRDPETGEIEDASDLGLTLGTFTGHRSPLGLVFDVERTLAPEFRGDGFVLSIGGGCCQLVQNMQDPDEDMLHLDLEKKGDRYEVRIRRIVEGFRSPIDAEIIGNKIYVIEWDGTRGLWEFTVPLAPTAIAETESEALPNGFALYQNYPNPFNAATAIRFALPAQEEVELGVYNMTGQRVATLAQGVRQAGVYIVSWHGLDESGAVLASGIYFYRLRTGHQLETRKLVLLR